MYALIGGLYLGWALGANNAGNVFGTAVAARIVRFRNATILCSAAVILGAILQGAIWDESIPSYPLILRDSGYHIDHTL